MYIQLEGLAARLDYSEGGLIGLLKRSLMVILSDESKLGFAEVWWEGCTLGLVLGGGDWRKCT